MQRNALSGGSHCSKRGYRNGNIIEEAIPSIFFQVESCPGGLIKNPPATCGRVSFGAPIYELLLRRFCGADKYLLIREFLGDVHRVDLISCYVKCFARRAADGCRPLVRQLNTAGRSVVVKANKGFGRRSVRPGLFGKMTSPFAGSGQPARLRV